VFAKEITSTLKHSRGRTYCIGFGHLGKVLDKDKVALFLSAGPTKTETVVLW
jgi:hypothetical protein